MGTDRLLAAIRWALGESDEFRPRGERAGPYWWRTELRERAGLATGHVAALLPAGPNQCDGCRRGFPVRDGNHYDGERPYMGCTATRYATPTPTPAVADALARAEGGEEDEDDPRDVYAENGKPFDTLRSLFSKLPADVRMDAELALDQIAARVTRTERERDERAAWLAAFVIERMGGTPDVPAWVARSAEFYRALAGQLARAEGERDEAVRERDHTRREITAQYERTRRAILRFQAVCSALADAAGEPLHPAMVPNVAVEDAERWIAALDAARSRLAAAERVGGEQRICSICSSEFVQAPGTVRVEPERLVLALRDALAARTDHTESTCAVIARDALRAALPARPSTPAAEGEPNG